MTELPDGVFRAVISALTGGFAGVWIVHDIVLMLRLRGADRRDPLVRDKWFGYAIGILIATVGIVGTLRFNRVI